MKKLSFIKILFLAIFTFFVATDIVIAQIHYDSSGNVGIGTTSPGYELDVSGDINFTGNLYKNGIVFGGGGGGSLWTESGENIYRNSGNVGIGTTTPGAKLVIVKGNAPAIQALSGSSSYHTSIAIGRSSEEARIGIASSNGQYASNSVYGDAIIRVDNSSKRLHFLTGTGIAVMTVTSSNVGIGTTSPAQELVVEKTDTSSSGVQVIIDNKSTTTNSYSALQLNSKNGTVNANLVADGLGGIISGGGCILRTISNYPLAFGTNWSEKMRITTGGNVGIGTTSPVYKLDVAGDINFTGNIYKNGNTFGGGDSLWTESGGNIYRSSGSVGIGTTYSTALLHVKQSGTGDAFRVDNDDYGSYPFVIKDNGKVGIGTLNPQPNIILDVNGNQKIAQGLVVGPYPDNYGVASYCVHVYSPDHGAVLTLQANSSSQSAIHFGDMDYIYSGVIRYYHPDNSMRFDVNGNERMRIINNGNVGIGTTSPSYKLDVNGEIRCTSLIQTSDIRLKSDIMPIDNALEKVMTLHGVEFRWRTEDYPEKDLDEGRKIGLIAQEVEAVLPEVVSTDDEGYKAIEYGNIVSVLVEAIKAQQVQIQAQQVQIEALQNRIMKLENR